MQTKYIVMGITAPEHDMRLQQYRTVPPFIIYAYSSATLGTFKKL